MPSLWEACLGILFNVLPKSVPHIASDGVYVLCKTNMLKTVVHSYLNNCLSRRRPLFLPRGLYFHTGRTREALSTTIEGRTLLQSAHTEILESTTNSLYLSGKNALLTSDCSLNNRRIFALFALKTICSICPYLQIFKSRVWGCATVPVKINFDFHLSLW